MIEKRGEGENIFVGREQFTPWAKAMAYTVVYLPKKHRLDK